MHLTADTKQALDFNITERIPRLEGQFGADLVLRSAVWLTVKEGWASFAIQHEEDKRDRIQRFAVVMEQHTGRSPDPPNPTELEALQREILGPNALQCSRWACDLYNKETKQKDWHTIHATWPMQRRAGAQV